MQKNKIKYDARFELRLFKEELAKLDQLAESYGYKDRSAYVRKKLFKTKIKSKFDLEMIVQLKKIGTNINQIARKINTVSIEKVDQNEINSLKNSLENCSTFIQALLSDINK